MNDRRDPQPNDLLSFGPFSLLTAERLLKKADESIPLGGRALDILIALVERAGEVVTHREPNLNGVAGFDRGGRQSPRSHRGPSEGAWRRARRRSLRIQCCWSRVLFCCASHTLKRQANRFRSPGLPSQNEFKGCRCD